MHTDIAYNTDIILGSTCPLYYLRDSWPENENCHIYSLTVHVVPNYIFIYSAEHKKMKNAG